MMYAKQNIIIATKHHKERVIGPILKQHLGCKIHTSSFDTDTLGTFTGEVPRLYSAQKTCEMKAHQAASIEKALFAIASEGSFGPHPLIPMIPQAHEIMVFIDKMRDLTIVEHLYSQETNYLTQTIHVDTPLEPLLQSVQFPSHALCIQTSKEIYKGIQSYDTLQTILNKSFQQDKSVFLSTDMRAMMNPTRMKVIEELTQKLVVRIRSTCPSCSMPGFGIQKIDGHLPCEYCKRNSQNYAFEIWGCCKCDYHENRNRKDGKTSIDPQFCNFCNP